jgi:hypothetical protein
LRNETGRRQARPGREPRAGILRYDDSCGDLEYGGWVGDHRRALATLDRAVGGRGERKHRIAEEYLATHTVGAGVFLILVARAAASVWEVKRSASGVIANLEKKTAYVNHYSFHIMDPDWGHLTVKLSGHPPFGARVIANGHEWVACQARPAGIGFTKEGNCLTAVVDPQALAQVADTLSQPATAGRLRQVCERWIYSACLCLG